MDWKSILNLVCGVCVILCYFFSEYYKKSATLRDLIALLIADAEEAFKEQAKSGKEKMAWVLDQLYEKIPLPFKPFFTKIQLEEVVQKAFDAIAKYADIQVAKLKAKYETTKKIKK
ncbi:MAG: hypothetical protein VB062_04535 [Christensenella sp.]|nr:hypothetical protein [Christensenella sp.]